jgi:Tfp pilus assembly protein PilW
MNIIALIPLLQLPIGLILLGALIYNYIKTKKSFKEWRQEHNRIGRELDKIKEELK